MYTKIKYASLLFILIAFSGCSLFRKSSKTEPVSVSNRPDYNTVINSVLLNNITEKGFEIKKGSIELEGTEIEGKFGLFARLNNRGDFYASVKGPLGIELVRLLMVGNDIAAIDRFNKTVYIGKKDAILKKNGMPEDFMEIIFGDMPEDSNGDYRYTQDNMVSFTRRNNEYNSEISICPGEMKICSEEIYSTNSGQQLYITFGKFGDAGGVKYPGIIELSGKKRMFHVKLIIDEIVYGYNSEILFNLPSYKRESL